MATGHPAFHLHIRLYKHNFQNGESCVDLNTRSWLQCCLEGLTLSENVNKNIYCLMGVSGAQL